jgi:hypothetical protein
MADELDVCMCLLPIGMRAGDNRRRESPVPSCPVGWEQGMVKA